MKGGKGKHMKIGLTGSGGFLGGALAEALPRTGLKIVSLDPWTRGERPECPPPGELDWVVHLGARVAVEKSFDDPFGTYRHNLDATLGALEIAAASGSAFLFMSSYVYGRPRYQPIDEEHPLEATNPYMGSKIAGEWICRQIAAQKALPLVILRAFNIYGTAHRPGRLVSDLLDGVRRGEPLAVRDPRPRRDYLYVADFCRLVALLLRRRPEGCVIYNVGHGTSHSNLEVAELVRALSGEIRPVVVLDRPRAGDVADVRADVSRLRRDVGWTPACSLEEGLGELIARIRSGEDPP